MLLPLSGRLFGYELRQTIPYKQGNNVFLPLLQTSTVILPLIFKLCDFALIIFKRSCRLPQRVFAPVLTIFLVDFAPVL